MPFHYILQYQYQCSEVFYNSKAILFIHFLFAFGQGLQNKFAHTFNFGSLRFGIQIIWTLFNINLTQPLFKNT